MNETRSGWTNEESRQEAERLETDDGRPYSESLTEPFNHHHTTSYISWLSVAMEGLGEEKVGREQRRNGES